MRIAVVCDDLIQFGGQEKLVLKLCEIFPSAVLFSPVISDKWRGILSEKNIKYTVSFLQNFPFTVKLNKFYGALGLYILALENFCFDDYDYVISVSSRFAHGILTKPTTKHIAYINSPGRMFWEPSKYFLNSQRLRLLLLPFLSYFRIWDYVSGHRADKLIANSQIPQKRIKKYYHRDSSIIYPFHVVAPLLPVSKTENYFVLISRLVDWKRIDIAVEAFTKLGWSLKIIGTGPATHKLRTVAGSNIEILGFVSDDQKHALLASCRAVIQTQYEDFGIVPLEALAIGKPVIAYGKGGVVEIVEHNATGLLFETQSAKSLVEVLGKFERNFESNFNSRYAQASVKKFSPENFEISIKQELTTL